ncbi:type II toxin-antitoxin system RelE/ParE family toxin [Phenylobacterium sp.]|uniref:type II toxin-antitoxin system RelE/ParE family toxin n=1 Tax=Phenylobacterium sp. TaxID=1871053 RepID=UPI00286E5FE1|nr:type II toxin-antitoxin system RelE/ParE family toxin [Phenylobacterium sp.]
MPGQITFRPAALDDLLNLFDYIADEASPAVAGGYIDRVEQACRSLTTFPERGSRRDDLAPGLRTLGFERRATIVFRVTVDDVQIVRIFYGGQDFDAAFRDDDS